MNETDSLIAAMDVAVVDPDLIWRVEHMNLLRHTVVREFSAPQEALDAMVPGHPALMVLGPTVPADDLETACTAAFHRPELRTVLCTPPGAPSVRPGPVGADRQLAADVDDETFREVVEELLQPMRGDRGPESSDAEPQPTSSSTTSSGSAAPPPRPTARPATDLRGTPGHGASPSAEGGEETPTRLVVVTSAKGGEGTSTVAINLAHSLARVPGTTTALLDGEPYFGDITMDLGEAIHVGPVVTQLPIPVDQAEMLVTHADDPGPRVVRFPMVGPDLVRRVPEVLRDLLTIAHGHAHVVVADVPFDLLIETGLGHDAAVVVLVTSRRTTSVKNTIVASKRLPRTDNVGVVINEVDRRARAIPVDELASAMQLPLLGHLPYSGTLHRAAGTALPDEVAGSHSRYARAVDDLRRNVAAYLPVFV